MGTDFAALIAQQHGAFTQAQARATGVTREAELGRIRRGQWEALGGHVLAVCGAPRTWLQRLMAAVLDAGPRAVASHLAAARLWALPGFTGDDLTVTRPRDGTQRRSPLATVHEPVVLADHHVTARHGIPVTNPGRTLFDVAGVTHVRRLERAVDNAVAMRLTTYDQLWTLLGELRARGRPGIAAMRAVLADRPPTGVVAVESELEARFRSLLRRAGLPQPEWQVVVGSDGAVAGRVDALFRSAGLIVELDGRRFHSSPLDREADARRDLELTRTGRRVLRLTWDQVTRRPEAVAAALHDILRPFSYAS